MQLEKGTQLQDGKYVVIKDLGQGGFGITYIAEQVALSRKVAIKEFFLKKICSRDSGTSRVTVPASDNTSDVELFKRKFIKEARNLSRLDHPNIIRVYDCFEENDTVYYVMELVTGGSLNDYLENSGGRLTEDEALGCIKSIAKALEYLHQQSMNHLDVKPDNVLRRENGELVLIDFGLTKTYDTTGSETSSTPVGRSPGYAPLEQYNPGGVSSFTPQTDVYSLGATLYKLLTGTTPPEASVILNSGLPPMNADVSPNVIQAINIAMSPMCKNRPSSVGEFIALLDSSAETQMQEIGDDLMEDEATIMPTMPSQSTTQEESSAKEVAEAPKVEVSKEPTNKPTTPPAMPEYNSKKILLIVVLVFALVIVIILATQCGGDKSGNDPQTTTTTSQSDISALITKVESAYDEYKKGEKGLLINVDFTAYNMKSQSVICL
ncbi:MAG: serine/threonine-protein kinase, partial [Rikenellaceae bacterium]